MPSTNSPAAEDDPSGISSVLTASARYFGKMLPPAPVGIGATEAVRVPAAVNPNSEKKQNPTGRSSSKKEADGYYPQSWLIAYFAVNGLRCAAAADAEPPFQPPSPPSPSQSSNPSLLAVSGATADALIAALSACCVEERIHEEELDREVSTNVGGELCNKSGHGDAGASVCILPQWLRRGLLHHSKAPLSDVSCNDVALMESIVAVGVAPDGPPRFATADKSSASAGSAAPALGPTVTLTFCCAQALLGMRRDIGGHHHDGGNDDATDTTDTINSSSSNKRPPSLSLLEEASLALMSGGGKCGGADGGRLLLLFRMALFAWRRLAAFADRFECSSEAGGGEGGLGLAAPIEDPRDLYSALMLLWLAYKHARAHETIDTCSSAVKGAVGSSYGRSVASSLQEAFVRDTWASCGQPTAAIGQRLRQWIFQSCYVPHEGAFGAPPPPPPLLTSSPSRAVEAHSGMTYCCVVSLALLGHGTYRGDQDGVCELRGRPHSGSTTSSFAPRKQRHPFASALRRYLYARQAHFGLSLSEFEDYSDVSDEEEADGDEENEEGCDSDSDSNDESDGSVATSGPSFEYGEGWDCADSVGGNFLRELHRLRDAPNERLSEALRRRPHEASLRWPGFQGRPNKDSDTCYSFWALGALRALPFACGDVSDGATSGDEAATKWDAVDTFLGVDVCPPHMSREQCIEGPSGAGSCRPLLHDEDSLAAFTLLTASAASVSCPSASSGKAGKTLCCAPLSKDADADASPDPLHSALGLAGLTTAGGGVSRRLAAAVFPFV